MWKSKKTCVKESKHLYLLSQCFGNADSCIQMKWSDYCDGVSGKLKWSDYCDGVSAKLKWSDYCDGVSAKLKWSDYCDSVSAKLKWSDYCDGVSAKLTYLSSYGHTFNPVLFITSLERSYFGSRENRSISHQKSQIYKEIVVDISIF